MVDGVRLGKIALSFFVGAVVGVFTGEIIANSLIEISVTPVFSTIFGIALILMAAALMWRIWAAEPKTTKKGLVAVFAVLVAISGICCFLLEEKWVSSLTPGEKVPMYSLIGLSLAFSLVFCFVELLNMGLCTCCCRQYDPKPMIGSVMQISIVIGTSLVLGLTFGCAFGLLDVEDDQPLHPQFRKLEIISIPVGIVLGGLAGALNEWQRGKQVFTTMAHAAAPGGVAGQGQFDRLL